MKVCVFGAGAIGGLVGARLAQNGVDVSLIARGPHLAAMRERGLRCSGIDPDDDFTVQLPATDDPAELGVQDVVFVGLKAHSAAEAAGTMTPLLGPDTVVVPAVNGFPWWYFHGFGDPYEGHQVHAVDPGGAQWNAIGPDRVVGCVVYPAADLPAPGHVRHTEGNRMLVGEPDGAVSDRARVIGRMLTEGGFRAPVRRNLRGDVWMKLWGNLAFNPVSALTGGTLEELAADPAVRSVIRAMMQEGEQVANALGVKFPLDIETRIDGAGAVGPHKSSTLQDLEQGRPLEIDALTLAVSEVGKLVGVETPTIDLVYALVRQRAVTKGCMPA
ncbi:MAG: 2-dehydropantoate 2-reductase [Rhodospirillales bacterium]|nr:2-dehydropantoate 2-reductase [Rhodospirillales bacterium]MDE0371143.1 2-dehydropantoate 2-reductase [Rhodospirillales bacterium]